MPTGLLVASVVLPSGGRPWQLSDERRRIMQTIEYRAVYAEGSDEIIRVRARTINSGFTKALRLAREPLGNGRERELSRLEFWMIR